MRSASVKSLYYPLSFLSKKLNKKPLTIRRAKGLGIERHSLPSIYARMPENTKLRMPRFHINFPFFSCSRESAGTIALPSSLSGSFFKLILATNFPACFLSMRIAKLTTRCSHNVHTVGPIFHSCDRFSILNFF